MDASGIPACAPIYKAAKATYHTWVDPRNALSEALGFKVIPNGFLIDEIGVVRAMKVGGFEVKNPATITMVEDFLALPKAIGSSIVEPEPTTDELKKRVSKEPSGENELAYGKALLADQKVQEALPHLESAVAKLPSSSSAHFALGSWLVQLDKRKEALKSLREALRLDRSNFVIRKQIWLIEFPEKFHPEIDWAWQRVKLKEELDAEKKDGEPPLQVRSESMSRHLHHHLEHIHPAG